MSGLPAPLLELIDSSGVAKMRSLSSSVDSRKTARGSRPSPGAVTLNPGLAKLEAAVCHLVHTCVYVKAFSSLSGSENGKLIRAVPSIETLSDTQLAAFFLCFIFPECSIAMTLTSRLIGFLCSSV